MPKRKPVRPEPEMLVARIEQVEPSYYISSHGTASNVGDEAILDITGIIEQIGARYRDRLGQEIAISMVMERRFLGDEARPTADKPMLLSVNLRKGQQSLMAYLPADVFWALPPLIAAKAITHVEARFEKPHHGWGVLDSLHFVPRSKLAAPD